MLLKDDPKMSGDCENLSAARRQKPEYEKKFQNAVNLFKGDSEQGGIVSFSRLNDSEPNEISNDRDNRKRPFRNAW